MTEDNNVFADLHRRFSYRINFNNRLIKRFCRCCTNRATNGDTHMGNNNVGSRLCHRDRFIRRKHIGRCEKINLMRHADHIDF